MDPLADLRLILVALRDRLVDPDRIADAGLSWSPADGPLLAHLAARGVLNPDAARRLEHLKGEQQTPGATPSQSCQDTGPFQPTPVRASEATTAASGGALPLDTQPSLTAPPGGRYEPLRHHRSGGLGQVWLARDTVIGREVALKSLRPDRSDAPGATARFVREAQLTARLEHPGIVPLYDLIEQNEEGGPWYVMRFVAGRTLAEATSQYHRRRQANEAGPLELAGLLDALVAVCRAVAFAHSRDVLHRDLKGQNVILGEFGEVFLLDWGLAKPMAEGTNGKGHASGIQYVDETAAGSAVGTPAYMSPEVAAGKPASKSSDVYGLGAVLYTILAGQAPARGATPQDVLRTVASTAPPAPRSVNPDVPAALEAVCLKAMARDPAARYATADELATDVRRWLADEPVSAYPEPGLARAARWAKRRRTAVVSAAAFLVTAVLGLAVTTVLVWREQRATAAAKDKADSEWARAETERERASANFETARSLAMDLGARIGRIETGLATPREVDEERKRALEAAGRVLDRFRAEAPDDAVLQKQSGMLHRYAANVARSMNDVKSAESSYRASLRTWEGLSARHPRDPAYRNLLVETLWDHASLLRRSGRLREAAATLERAVSLAESLAELGFRESSRRRTMGTALLERAGVEYLRGEFAKAEGTARRSVELYDGLRNAPAGEANPSDPLLAAMAANRLAAAMRGAGRGEATRKAHDDAVRQADALAGPKAGRDVLFLSASTRIERARTDSLDPARHAAARKDFDDAAAVLSRLVTEYPSSPMYREWLAVAYLGRGELQVGQGRAAPAKQDLDQARELLERLVRQHPEISDFRGLLGRTCIALGRNAAAAADNRGAAEWYRQAGAHLQGARAQDPENAHHRRAAEELDRLLQAKE